MGTTIPSLSNHPGRATLVSGPKRHSISPNIPITNRTLNTNFASASSPSFSSVDHIRSYSISRTHSDHPSHTSSNSSTPSSSRRTSVSDAHEKSRRGSSQMVKTPKSLRECQEQPASLLEQPFLLDNVNVQILSPHQETHAHFFDENDLNQAEENSNTELENDVNENN